MKKKQYIFPEISVVAIEVTPVLAASPTRPGSDFDDDDDIEIPGGSGSVGNDDAL